MLETCVERFGLVEMYGSLLCCYFLGWDGSVSNCGKVADATPGNNTCGGVVVFFPVLKEFFSYRSPEQVGRQSLPNIASNTCKICIVETFAKLLSNLYIEVGTWLIVENTQKERKIRLFLYRIRVGMSA